MRSRSSTALHSRAAGTRPRRRVASAASPCRSSWKNPRLAIVPSAPPRLPRNVTVVPLTLRVRAPFSTAKLMIFGTVPLLTREGEVEIARRIERGKLSVIKSISRMPAITKAVIRMGDQLRAGERTIRELVIFNDEEITDERIAEERLLHDAVHDNLTGLPNRELFLDRLSAAMARSEAEQGVVAREGVLAPSGRDPCQIHPLWIAERRPPRKGHCRFHAGLPQQI